MPFDIPDNWTYFKLEWFTYPIGGRDNQIQAKEILKNGIVPVVSQGQKLIEGYSNSKVKTIHVNESEPVILFGDHTRNVKLIDFDFIIGADGTKTFKPILVDARFLYYVLIYVADTLKNRGYARHYSLLKNELLPLPPLAEQARIVAKIDSFEPLLQKYDALEKELSALEEGFPEALKKSILQYAIEGKLVKQDPNDEPASVLLERIRKEKEALIKAGKIKREKDDSYIYRGDDKNYYEKIGSIIQIVDVPFDLPSSWNWALLKQLLENIQYGFNGAGMKMGMCRLLRITDIQNGNVKWENLPYCDISGERQKEYQIKEGDIFIARTGGTIGKSYRLDQEKQLTVFAGYLIRIQIIDTSLSPYIDIVLNTPLYWNQVADKSAGTGQPNINAVSLGRLLIPVAPAREQQRIMDKLMKIKDCLNE